MAAKTQPKHQSEKTLTTHKRQQRMKKTRSKTQRHNSKRIVRHKTQLNYEHTNQKKRRQTQRARIPKKLTQHGRC